MKRGMRALPALLAAALLLAGCTPAQAPAAGDTQPPAAAATDGPAAGDAVLFTDSAGREVEVPAVIDRIAPEKDVDGFHMLSAGALLTGQRTLGFRPCTPMGVMKLIEEAGVDPAGKNVLVIGRSNIVGKPLAIMLLEKHATVTIAHSRTTDLKTLARNADIIVAAAGRIGLVTGDMIKPGALVIDVGTNRKPDGKLTGDVDFAAALEVAAAVTPVPGGVGPMTIAMLMKNTVESAERRLAQLP